MAATGKRALVTGANTGIGKEIARGLARSGMAVVMGCKNRERGEAARQELVEDTGNQELSVMHLDLSSLQSIRSFAQELNGRYDQLDLLVNNAGVSRQDYSETHDGFEMVFGVNFLGPFLLTNLLIDALAKAAPSRIVNVASSVHRNGHIDRDDPQMKRGWRNRQAYANSKLADILFTRELARRFEHAGISANCYNPSLVRSEFFRSYDPVPFMLKVVLKVMGKTPAEGASTGVYLALSQELPQKTGGYYENSRLKQAAAEARDDGLAAWLWDYAAHQVGLTG